MKRPKGMPRHEWENRNAPPTKDEMTKLADENLMSLRDAGVEWVEWLTAGDGEECEHCKKMSGKVMRLRDVPFSEHPDCEHEMGCRCVLIAVESPGNR